MKEPTNEQQLFYSQTGGSWNASTTGERWSEEKCAGWLYKHLTWNEFQAIVNPPPTQEELFNSEMDALNTEHDKAMTNLSVEYNVAVARDGSTETEKVTAIRAKITALDGKYETDQTAIINKYFGA